MTLYMGIDVGKRKHTALVINEHGQRVVKAFTFANDRRGIEQVLAPLRTLTEPVEVALEATGHYWLALFAQLTQAGYHVHVFNPLQVHAYQRSGIRQCKQDRIDAFWIADYLRIGGVGSNTDQLETHLQLRQLARFRASLSDQIGDAKRRILAVLDQVFPEYATLFSDVFVATARQLLAEAVLPQEFASFDLEELRQRLHAASRGRFGADKAATLQATARASIGVAFLADAARVQVSCLLEQIALLERQLADLDAQIARLVATLPDQYLTTIPGVSVVTAATLLGEIGSVDRFDTLEQLVAYAGIDPSVYQSGAFEAEAAHMSKRGSPYLRRALWVAATAARVHDPELRAYYAKRRAEGKAHGTVMGAICRKLLARIYAVLRDGRPYIIRVAQHSHPEPLDFS